MEAIGILPLRWVSKFRAGSFERQVPKAGLSMTTSAPPELVTFIQEVAGLEPQPYLPSLLSVLQAKGEVPCSPYERRKGLFPLAIPLSEQPASDGSLTALLRWPTPVGGMDVPVVSVHKHGVTLLAKSMKEYIHRALVEEESSSSGQEDRVYSMAGDVGQKLYSRRDYGASKVGSLVEEESSSSGQEDRVYSMAGDVGQKLYSREDYGASKVGSLDVYLLKKVGKFPDVCERLALNHLAKSDEISALVTGEFYCRQLFPGFGRPYVFNAQLLLKVGRKLEAKEAARIALKSPWWTLGCSYETVAEIAGWGDEQVEFMKERVTEEGRKEDLLKGKTAGQVALDQAAFLLDLSAVDGSWDEIREQLASFYSEAGMEDVSRFILTTSL